MSSESLNINPENISDKILLYENYFKGTMPLKDNFRNKELEIKSNVRVFKSQEKECGYDEIFLNKDSETFGGISNHISLLYPPKIRGYQNRIGFRYYKEKPLLSKNSISYFTLVRTGIGRFIILEKESEIKDNSGKSFIIEDLDCFDIILTIIKEKIRKDEDYLTYPNSICEILGFIYASKCIKNKVNNIEILHPFIPSPFTKETLNEEKKDIDTSKFFIEPIMCNKHITLLLFYYKKKSKNYYLRKNILFDMSSAHYKCLLKKDPIFDEEMRYDLIKFPSNSIQIGSSCSMWFYASLLFLLQEKIELPFNNDTLYKIIDKLYDLFNCKEQDINKNKIDNRESENIDKDEFISYKLALKPFIDIDSVLEQLNSIKNIGPGGLGEYQKIFLELKNNINLIKINNEYYAKIFNAKIVSEKEMNSFNSLLSSLEKSFYSIIETRKKLYEYMNGNTIVHLNLEDLNKNIENSIKYFSLSAKEIKTKLSNIANKYTLYSKHRIHEFYFDNKDIFLNIMDS